MKFLRFVILQIQKYNIFFGNKNFCFLNKRGGFSQKRVFYFTINYFVDNIFKNIGVTSSEFK